MKTKSIAAVIAVVLAALCGGCADPEVFPEIFQLMIGDKLYTRYNIWYTDPNNIGCLNVQQGSMIPIGTEIEPIAIDPWTENVRFKDMEGREYRIIFDDGYRMCTVRQYVLDTFTTKNREEQLAGVPDKVRTRILRGEVVEGMDQAQVMLSYGPPAKIRTPDMRNDTWFYWTSPENTVRLVFRNDKVRQIVNLQQ
ncbi:MAG: hypothetical protein MJ025_02400 [Victivallaceae bacterium]|nr:hypothetical protein [Victivallaceae bacterium]